MSLTAALQTPIGSGPHNALNSAIAPQAVEVQGAASNMLNKAQLYKSKVSKSK